MKYKLRPGFEITRKNSNESDWWTQDEIMNCFEPFPESTEIEPLERNGSDYSSLTGTTYPIYQLSDIGNKLNEVIKVVNQLTQQAK